MTFLTVSQNVLNRPCSKSGLWNADLLLKVKNIGNKTFLIANLSIFCQNMGKE